MRKLTAEDITNIIGLDFKGYKVERARVKRERFSDSDHYGIVLAKSSDGKYVTWQFHLDEDDKPTAYWGHYFLGKLNTAILDYKVRDADTSPKPYTMRITETLEKAVVVEAVSREEAERIVAERWYGGQYILGPEDFTGAAEFVAWEGDNGGA